MKLQINNKNYNIPESIDELSWKQLLNLQKLNELSYLPLLSALLDEDLEFVFNLKISEADMMALYDKINWITLFDWNSLDRNKLSISETEYLISYKTVDINYLKNATFGQLITIFQVMDQYKDDIFKVRDAVINLFLGYQFAGEDKWKGDKNYRQYFHNLPAKDIFKLSSFFLTILNNQMKPGKVSKKLNLIQTLKIFKQVWISLKNTVFGPR